MLSFTTKIVYTALTKNRNTDCHGFPNYSEPFSLSNIHNYSLPVNNVVISPLPTTAMF